jgi:hypothetical protein
MSAGGGVAVLVTTPYCRGLHRIADGLPVAHRCVVLPAEALRAACNEDYQAALRIFATCGAARRLERHPGLWKTRRRK